MLRLSPTTGLSLFKECPRCFWLHYVKNVHRPRGIFPSLPGGMDLVIKKYFDQYRGSLPPELEDKVPGVLVEDGELMNKWRNWRTGLRYKDKKLDAELFGALDDALIDPDGYYIPLDYKTRGSAPRDGDSEKYYQTQLDAYALLLAENGYPVRELAYLVYYYPEIVESEGIIKFNIEPVKVNIDPERAKKLFEKAVKLLNGPAPKSHSECEYCIWLGAREEFE